MNARIIAVLVLSALLLTSACAAASPATTADRGRTAESAAAPRAAAPAAAPPAPAPAARAASGGGANSGAAADQAQQNLPAFDRMIIRTVTMTIAVANVQESFRQVEQIVAEQKGYLSGTQIRQEGDRQTATMTIRVPADPTTYQATLERLRGIAERVMDEQSQAQDVTEEYVDIDARLRTLKASEESLLALLGKAQKVDDIIQVQRELTNVRSQIEQIQGRKQALERRADMATITLTIREAGSFARAGWSPGAAFEEAVRALGSALRGVVTFAIWLAVFSPIWGGALVIGYFVLRLLIVVMRRLFRSADSRPAKMTTPTPPSAAPTTPAAPSAPAGTPA